MPNEAAAAIIFYLTFFSSNSIYESRCDFLLRSQISIRRIKDGNQEESCTEEESRRQEKEVTTASKTDQRKGPGNGAFFLCAAETGLFFIGAQETGYFYLCRPRCTIPRKRCVNSWIQSALRETIAAWGIRSSRIPSAAAPASMNCIAVC